MFECIYPLCMICGCRCYWIWSVSLWTFGTEMRYMVAWSFPMFVNCSWNMDLICGWPRMSNLIYFSYWDAKMFIIPVLIIRVYSWYWSWTDVSLWTYVTEMLCLLCQCFSMAVICSYHLVLSFGWSGFTKFQNVSKVVRRCDTINDNLMKAVQLYLS